MKSLRIIVIASYYYPALIYGGPVHSIHRRNYELANLGNQVYVFTTDANGKQDLIVPLQQPLFHEGISITYFPRWWFGAAVKPFGLFFSLEMGRRLQQTRREDYDLILIHAGFGDPGRLAASMGKRTGTPYFYYTHGIFEPWAVHHNYWKKKLYLYLVEKKILDGAAGIVVCNNAEIGQLHQLGIKSPIRRIPWGVDLPNPGSLPPRELLADIREALVNRPFFLFLSRLHPKKGLNLLIPAFRAVTSEFPDWLLVISGPDERGYLQFLKKMIKEVGLERRVILTGLVTGDLKASLLTHTEFLVLPSYSEGFPISVAEALGYGRPVIITKSCYVPEVADGGAGLEVPAKQEALEDAMRELMRDDRLRKDCSRNAREVAETHFSWKNIAHQSMAFYRQALACHSIT